MTDPPSYFAAADPSFWKWRDKGTVVTWADGDTIAFRQELAVIFRHLPAEDVPPFGAALLLLAACRETWTGSLERCGFIGQLSESDVHGDRMTLLRQVCERLDRIRGLDATLRTSPEAKGVLAATVFEGRGRATRQTLESIVHDLGHGLPDTALEPTRRLDGIEQFVRELAWLRPGLERIDAEALALRLKTGLERRVTAAGAIEPPPPGATRRLLVDLVEDAELGGVARLAKLLLAAIHVPTPMSLPAELPVGGVSDISNRGSLDRLLISELANDGLALAVRVAMNEALYLRRETPPRPPARRRLVLLDSGLRMWGVPRVFATAVGLAFAAAADATTEVRVYRAAGRKLEPVDCTAASGIADHLAVLDHHADPGAALEALAAEAEAAGGTAEVVIVTGADVLRAPEFASRLDAFGEPEVLLASVGRDGDFQLRLRTKRGCQVVRTARFALDDVLFPPRTPLPPLVDPVDAEGLPAIFHAAPFPLRMACPVEIERSWHTAELGTLTYCRDGRLLRWDDAGRGALEIAAGLPEGKLQAAASRLRAGAGLAIVGKLSRGGLHLVTYDRDRFTVGHTPLAITIDLPTYAFLHDDVAFVGNADVLNACHVPTGALLAERSLAGIRHARARFFTCPSGQPRRPAWSWRVPIVDAAGIRFEEFYQETLETESVATAFDCDDRAGPMVLTKSGALIHCSGQQCHVVASGAASDGLRDAPAVSRNGKRLLLARKNAPQPRIFDLATATIKSEPLECEVVSCMTPIILRHRFVAIGVDEEQRLVLVGRRDSFWPVSVGTALGLPSQPSTTPLKMRRPFEPRPRAGAARYDLSVARFADGSRALLDSRGLLHLRSSDPALPEQTIVLVQGPGAGWMSTGRTWGDPFFHDGPAENLTPHPVEAIQDFVTRLR